MDAKKCDFCDKFYIDESKSYKRTYPRRVRVYCLDNITLNFDICPACALRLKDLYTNKIWGHIQEVT